jgi:hypothetical protein
MTRHTTMINKHMKQPPNASQKRASKWSPYKCLSRRGETTFEKMNLPRYPPVLSWELNGDVTKHIFTFVDDESICTAMQVCKRFRDNLGSLRINVSMAGYKSFQAFRQWYYPRATFYSAHNSPFVTDEWLSFLAAHNDTRYDQLASIDIRGCNRITIRGIAQFVEAMDWRLERLAMSLFHESEIKDTNALRKLEALLGSAPCLKSLSLELNKPWVNTFSLDCLNGSTSLHELSLMLDCWSTDIPSILPNLETLKLEIIDGRVNEYWEQLSLATYPKLKHLEMTVTSHLFPHLVLDIDTLIYAIECNAEINLHGLESLVIRRREGHHAMDRGFARAKCMTHPMNAFIFRRSISVEREDWKELKAVCKSRNIDCTFISSDP